MTNKNQALFLFTIGPVQSFIVQARKTQDLFAGSQLLTDLCRFAINQIDGKNGNEIIFPNKENKSLPNRFMAIINTDGKDDKEIKKIGEDIKDKVKEKFIEITNKSPNSGTDSFKKQIENHLQINWVIHPYESDYHKAYESIEQYLGAIKNVRSFNQIEEQGRNCSICGERNALFYKPDTDEDEKEGKNNDKKIGKSKDNDIKPPYINNKAQSINKVENYKNEFKAKIENYKNKFQAGEGLCAICFTKRLYQGNKKEFPSLAKICVMDILDDLPNNEKGTKYEDYKENFGKLYYDEELLFEENLTEKYLKKIGIKNLKKGPEDIRKTRKELTEGLKLKKYYALIMLDGDNMGKWLSGDFLTKEYRESNLKKFHKKMSKALGEYAKTIGNDIISEPKGKVVYAGGDDVLAFVNLASLFDVLKELSNFIDFSKETGFKATKKSSASAGIVIAHYKTPLRVALQKAREMENTAKKNIDKGGGGRNAFAIAVLKRSGETVETVYKWEYDNNVKPVTVMKHLVDELQKDKDGFSNTFITSLRLEFQKLIGGKTEFKKGLIETEIKRLVTRSCMMTKEENKTKEEFKQRKKKAINKLSEGLNKVYYHKKLNNFLNFLEIADFITRKVH